MNNTFQEIINNNLSISLKKINIIDLRKSFTIANYYDIDNTLIFPISGNLRYGRYKKQITSDSFLFVPAHNTVSISLGSKRTQTLAYEDFIDNKEKYIFEKNSVKKRHDIDRYLIINIDVKAYDLVNIFDSRNLDAIQIKNNLNALNLLKNIIKEFRFKQPGFNKVVELTSHQLVYEIIREILAKQPLFSAIEENFNFFNEKKILDLFLFIDKNLNKELSNKVISNHLNISEDYVGQFFRNNIGFSPQDYIEHKRMEKAIKLLREESNAIKAISNDVGYRDTAYFCRRFKLMFGVQDGKMRKRLNEI